jgi:outer membrane protein OmpA-like peptidoglycan-associated protein
VNPQANAEELFKDDDNDGVPNILDREPNTKKGCPVDSHGVILDSDRDGIPDCEDKEPFSPPAYPVDSNGVAIVPPNPCCDTTRYYKAPESVAPEVVPVVVPTPVPGAPAVIDTVTGLPTKPPVIVPVVPKKTITDCSKIDLPFIVFDGETYFVDPQYYGNLHQIAERMQLCPEIKIVVTGYGAARNEQKFNEQLGWNRANAAVDYLVEKYGISRDRFILKYVGQKTAATGTPYERKMKNKSDFRYANEGETGESNPPAPHPGIKAGSNK